MAVDAASNSREKPDDEVEIPLRERNGGREDYAFGGGGSYSGDGGRRGRRRTRRRRGRRRTRRCEGVGEEEK